MHSQDVGALTVQHDEVPPGWRHARGGRSLIRWPRASSERWEGRYQRRLAVSDAGSAALAAALAFLIRFSESATDLEQFIYSVAVAVAPVVWLLALQLSRAYEHRFLGVGSEEYRRVLGAAAGVTAAIGTLSWALRLELARGFVIVALPTMVLLTLAVRYHARKRLHAQRGRGECIQRVVAVGHVGTVSSLVRQMSRAHYHGMVVVGACVPPGSNVAELQALGVEVLGDLDDAVACVATVDADVLAVLSCPELDGPALRRLGWALESTRAELIVAPAITEVVGPRIAIRPVCGLPLLHLERPELTGVRRLAKAVFDRCVSTAAAAALLPLLLVVAVSIKLDSRGPVFFRQQRVGRHGSPFTMMKFRTMAADAEQQLDDLLVETEGNGVLFKMRRDPRVTRVGRLLRRFSLDEVPQLLNVVKGEMSLVGPRPPLQREVDLYGDDMRRRLLVKPGLTGLWQINGRSDLDWDESVRLDLRYVENWSFAFDFMILWKTAAAVWVGRGAY